jgi:glyoxylase-like metal-dependent hydrolase (beta-lactamase superfamily II)
MIFSETGKLTDFFYVLGTRYFPTHLLFSTAPVLFEAGLSCLGPLYAHEIRRILQRTQPKILFLTHVHYDHCGAAGYLKRSFPEINIAASKTAAEIVQRPNARETMSRLNEMTLSWMEAVEPGLSEQTPFEPFDVDTILQDGDQIEIENGLTVQVFETPGHTWDSLSYYIPEKKLLVAGEAVGCMAPTGTIYTEFLVDYDAYVRSMELLSRLDVDILCQSHHQVLTGREAETFCRRSLRAAEKFKHRIADLLDAANGDVAKVVTRIKAEEYDPQPGPKQPEQAYLLNINARVRHLVQKLSAEIG